MKNNNKEIPPKIKVVFTLNKNNIILIDCEDVDYSNNKKLLDKLDKIVKKRGK